MALWEREPFLEVVRFNSAAITFTFFRRRVGDRLKIVYYIITPFLGYVGMWGFFVGFFLLREAALSVLYIVNVAKGDTKYYFHVGPLQCSMCCSQVFA